VADYIVSRLGGTAREIAGAIKRLHATSQALERPITLALAHEALDELIQSSHRAIRLADIERAVCHVFGLDQDTLQSSRKARHVSHPRMLAMWLARKYTRAAWSEIGQFFGRRSHSTVISAHRRVEKMITAQAQVGAGNGPCGVEDAIRRLETALRTA
jgi:chromosomal replication initiator protein